LLDPSNGRFESAAHLEEEAFLKDEEGDEECAHVGADSPTGRQGTDLMAAKAARQAASKPAPSIQVSPDVPSYMRPLERHSLEAVAQEESELDRAIASRVKKKRSKADDKRSSGAGP